ncbi:MAG: response regulator transcription factor [Zoogloea sp.]|nr:response regulator transcription factor [Zoogloea sp.]
MAELGGHIYLIDDDASMRTSLARMLEHAGYSVEAYAGAAEFLANAVPVSPAVVLLDMRMPEMSGLELQQRLIAIGCHTPIVFISGESLASEVVSGMKAGAVDFLIKPFSLEELFRAINTAVERDRAQFRRMTRMLTVTQCYETLTPREREVSALLVEGMMNKDIAKALGASAATVKVHRARIMEKMGADSFLSLVRMMDELALPPQGGQGGGE